MRRQTGDPVDGPVERQTKRRLLSVLAAAWLLVVLRSFVFVWYEHSEFDSDQAIYGLMAKHLIEGRAIPLFMYGQDYMLAMDTFVSVPFIAALGLSVFSLHLSILFTNLVIATIVIVTLLRHAELRPWQALVASLPFVFPPPVTSAEFMEIGGNIGPFLYVPSLWLLRKRPMAFGALVAIGTMHREFTAYAFPVILIQQAWSGDLWSWTAVRRWVIALAVALATWQTVQVLRPFSDVRGPGTRGLPPPADAGFSAVSGRIAFKPAEFPDRVRAMAVHHFPSMFGGEVGDSPVAAQGHPALFWPFTLGMLFTFAAAAIGYARVVAASGRSGPGARRAEFPIYLVGVGLAAVAGYVVTRPAEPFVDRYVLLAIYLPVGLASWCFASRPPAWVKGAVTASFAVMALSAAIDHRVLATRYLSGSVPNDLRAVADELERRHVTVAKSNYWRAYKLTFYTQERVKVASSDFVRIDEYQHLAAAQGDKLLVIQERSCPGGEKVKEWFFCYPGAAN